MLFKNLASKILSYLEKKLNLVIIRVASLSERFTQGSAGQPCLRLGFYRANRFLPYLNTRVQHQLLNLLRRDQLSTLLDDGGPKAVMRSRQKSQTPRHQLLKLLKRLVCTVRTRARPRAQMPRNTFCCSSTPVGNINW
jgi:hypothetical protein